MGQNDKLEGRSERQLQSERDNFIKWMNKWKVAAQYDEVGFIRVTPNLIARYKELYQI